ncbi:hypothetical protein EDD18DRAFT_1160999 [Armillaria luteobubalina]|uniref:F-box domain-containing protein n=1 Tax=Armillaria luteobubalina TaxID=153913 RepID=A0AA39Q6I1_9AGAR|nr:hypothetical protein EDD18DRAFT_1160999 [Armillaria luteobubalina]
MMTDTEKRIGTLDAHMLELKALKQAFLTCVNEELYALHEERQRLSDSIREWQIVFSALHHMPQEVLAHIFSHTLPTSYGLWTLVSARKHPLLTFELVSHNWKDVVDTFPFLWSYVNIPINRMTSNTYIRYIENQFSRSRQCPLSISICHSGNGSAFEPAVFPAATFMALSMVSPRVKTFRLHLPGKYYAEMQQIHLSFPNLQDLVVSSSSKISEVAQHLHFSTMPHLQVLHIMDISNIHTLSLPWHQITHFTSQNTMGRQGSTAHRVLDILKMMPHLSICRFSLDVKSSMTDVVEDMTLGHLNSLTLTSVHSQGENFSPVIPFVLTSLELPALLDLTVDCLSDCAWRDQHRTFTSIRHLIECSQSPLTSLSFNNGEIFKDDLIHILSSTPTLQDLHLKNVDHGITDEVINELTRRVDTGSGSLVSVLIPHLHLLHLSGHLEFHVADDFAEMVESRWTCRPWHLKSVYICRFIAQRRAKEQEEDNTSALSRLGVVVSEGLDVALRI